MDRARKQQRAVEALRQIGGEVLYFNHFQLDANTARFDKGKPLTPQWLSNIVGVDFFGSVRTVYLHEKTTDEHLAHLKSLPNVESLIVGSSKVTDSGVAHLKDLRGLKELSLESDKVTDAGIAHIASLEELRYLQLGCSFTDKGIEQLASLKKLEKLQIGHSASFSVQAIRTMRSMVDPITFEFFNCSLKEVVKYLGDRFDVSIKLDTPKIQAAGISPEVAVTAAGKNVPFEDELEIILDPLDLGWVITSTGLVITTREVAAEKHTGFNRLKKLFPNLKEAYIIID